MSVNEANTKDLVCTVRSGFPGKPCRKKYKTEKGIQKHYDTVHKAKLEAQNPMSNFKSYMESFVKEIFTGKPYDAVDTTNDTSGALPVDNPIPTSTVTVTAIATATATAEEVDKLGMRLDLLESQKKLMSMKLEDLQNRIKKVERLHKKYCIICWENESNYALIPCGHKIACGTCAFSILGGKRACPVCSNSVDDLLQIWDGGKESDSSE